MIMKNEWCRRKTGRMSPPIFGVQVLPAIFASLSIAAAAPVWEKPSLSLGSLAGNGGLHQRFELGVLAGSPEFAFPVFLEHGFLGEEGMTDYKGPQLESYVAPEGRDRIAWLEPGGILHAFEMNEILDQVPPGKQLEPWVAVRVGTGDYEFRSDDGWSYRYESGAIVSLAAPTGRVLRFETEGLRIKRIYQQIGDKQLRLLECEEDDFGRLLKLTIGPEIHQFKYSDETDQLLEWHAVGMGRNSATFSYTPQGLVGNVVLPGGKKLAFEWGGRDGSWQKDSGLKLPESGQGVFLIADNEFRYQYGITKAGVNLMRINALGASEGFIYNPHTQQLVRKSRDGGETTAFFGLQGSSKDQLERARDARGREAVRQSYDTKGRIISRSEPGRADVRFEYDDLDRITKVFRLDRLQTAYEYAGDSPKPVKITDALGGTIEIAYQPDGQLKRYKNLDGGVYEFGYDAIGQLVEERHPMGYTRTIERDEFGRVTRIKEIDGRESRRTYTGENRLESLSQNGSTWQYEYDPDGQLTRLLRDGETWQKTEREKLDGTGELVVRETNSSGDKTVLRYDKEGQLVRSEDPLGQAVSYKHDAVGQLTGWEDARGASVEFEHDALGRIAGVDTGEDHRTEMAYDLTGRIRRKNTGVQDIHFEYDPAGRLVRVDHGKGQSIDYTYDEFGRVLTSLTGQGVKTTYAWDALDRKTGERNDIPGAGYTLLEWAYTPSGRKKSVTMWKGSDAKYPAEGRRLLQKTDYGYDALGRYTVVSVEGGPKVSYEYDSLTLRLRKKRFSNGWVIAQEHFDDGHPKSIVATNAKGETVTECHYIWRDNKLQQRILNGVSHAYRYDALGRIIEVVKSKP